MRAASENGPGSAFCSGFGFFEHFFFFQQTQTIFFFFFYEELGGKRMFHMYVRALELDRSRSSTLPRDFPKIFHPVHALLLRVLIFELSLSRDLCECRTLDHIQHNILYSSSLSLHKHHSALFFSPPTHSALLYSCAVVVNKACPLASSFL